MSGFVGNFKCVIFGLVAVSVLAFIGYGCAFAVTSDPKQSKPFDLSASALSLEQRCRDMSIDGSYKYEVISGEVTGTELYPPRGADCFNQPDGCLHGQATLIASIKTTEPVKATGIDEIAVYTRLEPQEELYTKDKYLKDGQRYVACARKVDKFEFIESDRQTTKPKYKIDFVETIQQVN